jgi:hypothetical protein
MGFKREKKSSGKEHRIIASRKHTDLIPGISKTSENVIIMDHGSFLEFGNK